MNGRLQVFLALSFLFSSVCLAQTEVLNAKCVVGSDKKGITVLYDGKVRLAEGVPDFQSRPVRFQSFGRTRGSFRFVAESDTVVVRIEPGGSGDVVSLFLSPDGMQAQGGTDFLGLFFGSIPGFTEGVALWRYGPHGPWTEPVRIDTVIRLENEDVQFFYWKYDDGVYGAAMPLSGEGYLTTLGQHEGMFGSKSISYFSGMKSKDIPQMAVGFGRDPYRLFKELYDDGLKSIGKSEDLTTKKSFPKIFGGIGWCSWNASVYGTKLNENLLLRSAKDFNDANFPMKWFLVDDGWFDNTDGMLNSFRPDTVKFPAGFKPVIAKLKSEYHIADVGIWHAFDGYWNGINPNSELGQKFKKELMPWEEGAGRGRKTFYFVSPGSKGAGAFYEGFHKYLARQGFSFVKVDNQLVAERISAGNFPVFSAAENYHRFLNSSVSKNFNNAVINCMDMTPDAYLNFGNTAVARAEDDYGPEYDTSHTRNYWFRRAGDHILQEVYNSIYFSQMVYPDFDMFESINPAAPAYAIAHAMNDGPTYITDKINQHDFSVLWPLVYSDGTLLRADEAPLPTEDCLFNVNASRPFKAFSKDGSTGLLAIWNCVDSTAIHGTFLPTDVHGIRGDEFAVYEYFSKRLLIAGREDAVPFSLSGYGYKLYYIVPLEHGNGVIGLVNKYNAPASVLSASIGKNGITTTVHEGGRFAAVLNHFPTRVTVNGKEARFRYDRHLLTLDIPVTHGSGRVKIEIDL